MNGTASGAKPSVQRVLGGDGASLHACTAGLQMRHRVPRSVRWPVATQAQLARRPRQSHVNPGETVQPAAGFCALRAAVPAQYRDAHEHAVRPAQLAARAGGGRDALATPHALREPHADAAPQLLDPHGVGCHHPAACCWPWTARLGTRPWPATYPAPTAVRLGIRCAQVAWMTAHVLVWRSSAPY
jgi:hypothetical protein